MASFLTKAWSTWSWDDAVLPCWTAWTAVVLLSGALIYLIGRNINFTFRQHKYPVLSKGGIILITGCSSGIGLYTAEFLARHTCYEVYATVRRDEDVDKLMALDCKQLIPLKMDVTDQQSCERVMIEIKQHMEREKLPFVAIINNAAINAPFPAEFHPMEHAHQVFETNFFGILRLIQLTLPMLRQSAGRIVMISSFVTCFPVPKGSIYTASKCALDGLADSLRRELAPFDISVSLIEPGMVFSEMNTKNEQLASELLVDPEENRKMKDTYSYLYTQNEVDRFQRVVDRSDSPYCVTQAILHSIINPHPKTRYYVANYDGISVKLFSWFLWLMTDRWKDRFAFFQSKKTN